jgi:hypothetical protein
MHFVKRLHSDLECPRQLLLSSIGYLFHKFVFTENKKRMKMIIFTKQGPLASVGRSQFLEQKERQKLAAKKLPVV